MHHAHVQAGGQAVGDNLCTMLEAFINETAFDSGTTIGDKNYDNNGYEKNSSDEQVLSAAHYRHFSARPYNFLSAHRVSFPEMFIVGIAISLDWFLLPVVAFVLAAKDVELDADPEDMVPEQTPPDGVTDQPMADDR